MEVEKTIETFDRELEDTDCVRYLGLEGRIILKYFFMKCDKAAWTVLLWLRIGTGRGRL